MYENDEISAIDELVSEELFEEHLAENVQFSKYSKRSFLSELKSMYEDEGTACDSNWLRSLARYFVSYWVIEDSTIIIPSVRKDMIMFLTNETTDLYSKYDWVPDHTELFFSKNGAVRFYKGRFWNPSDGKWESLEDTETYNYDSQALENQPPPCKVTYYR